MVLIPLSRHPTSYLERQSHVRHRRTCHALSGMMPSWTIDLASIESAGAVGMISFGVPPAEDSGKGAPDCPPSAPPPSLSPPTTTRSSIAAPVASATSATNAAVGAICVKNE